MKTLNLTEKEREYLRYILNSGFQINQDLPYEDFKKEALLLEKLRDKLNN